LEGWGLILGFIFQKIEICSCNNCKNDKEEELDLEDDDGCFLSWKLVDIYSTSFS